MICFFPGRLEKKSPNIFPPITKLGGKSFFSHSNWKKKIGKIFGSQLFFHPNLVVNHLVAIGHYFTIFSKKFEVKWKNIPSGTRCFSTQTWYGGGGGGVDCLVLAKRFSTQTLVFLVEWKKSLSGCYAFFHRTWWESFGSHLEVFFPHNLYGTSLGGHKVFFSPFVFQMVRMKIISWLLLAIFSFEGLRKLSP